MRGILGRLSQLIHVLAVRRGLWESPSLSMMGANPKDYQAIIYSDHVEWVKRK